MSTVVTMAIVVRYGAAKGHRIDDRCSLDVAINMLWGALGDCGRIELIGRLGMLAAAELLLDDEAPEGVDVRGKTNATDIGRVINVSIAAQARRLINAAGVDPKAWEATR